MWRRLQMEETEAAHRIVVRMQIKDEASFQSGVAAFPRVIFYELRLPKGEAAIHLYMSSFEKPATRMPESMWLTFNPITEEQKGWSLDKTDEAVLPFDVVKNGNRHMHGLWKGFEYKSQGHRFEVP
jgi:hypothetical protein